MRCGDVHGATVLEHNTLLDADTGTIGEHHILDVDQDGKYDFAFYSWESYNDVSQEFYYYVSGFIEDTSFSILEYPESGIKYKKIDTLYDYDGGIPRKTFAHSYSCDSLPGYSTDPYNFHNENAAIAFNKFDHISDAEHWGNKNQYYSIRKEAHSGAYWFLNGGGDSLIGESSDVPDACFNAPINQDFYLAFRKRNSTGEFSYGWIELNITDHNALLIKRTAIFLR